MNQVSAVGLVVVVAWILCTLSTVMPYWKRSHIQVYDNLQRNDTTFVGLFHMCIDQPLVHSNSNSSVTVCFPFGVSVSPDYYIGTAVPSFVFAVRAMMILAILSLAASFGLSFLHNHFWSDKPGLLSMAAIKAFAGGVLSAIGVIVFGVRSYQLRDEYPPILGGTFNACFYLAIIGAVVSIISGAGILLAKRRTAEYSTME